MYPIITIGPRVIDMTGLTTIISLLILLVTVYILVKKSRLQFVKFFYRLPLPLILSYILGSYISFVIRQGSIIPTSSTQLMQRLSPYGYQFHIIGILIALAISIYLFLRKMPSRHERRVRINIIASAISLAMVPLGIGLLMGDHFVGLPTMGVLGVESLRPDISSRSSYGPVYPVGLLVAALGLIAFVIQRILQRADRPSGQGYMTLALIAICIGVIWSFVNTPKYLVLQTGPFRWDITTYLCLIIAGILSQQYMIEQERVAAITQHTDQTAS